ncbi:MAG: type II toxin-antitoxin system RelE/ParE family toxin [Bacteroidetes bacterium]|nr:type II toxin-antitoxin system RelE/ParE family toxin [Bacteroidota bacterium]
MARRIIWTVRAQNDRKRIFEYWNNRNKSKLYSRKLNGLIRQSVGLIAKYPRMGKPTNESGVRVKVLKDYLIIYQIMPKELVILTLWDCRQNPDDLKRIIK